MSPLSQKLQILNFNETYLQRVTLYDENSSVKSLEIIRLSGTLNVTHISLQTIDTNNHCLNVMVHRWMDDYVFDKSIFYFFSNVSSVILHSLSGNCFTVKNQICTSISESNVTCTYINITVTNISNNIIKQYYGIVKTFKVLVIVKKNQFSRTNILI